jgi:hypothetical protein
MLTQDSDVPTTPTPTTKADLTVLQSLNTQISNLDTPRKSMQAVSGILPRFLSNTSLMKKVLRLT